MKIRLFCFTLLILIIFSVNCIAAPEDNIVQTLEMFRNLLFYGPPDEANKVIDNAEFADQYKNFFIKYQTMDLSFIVKKIEQVENSWRVSVTSKFGYQNRNGLSTSESEYNCYFLISSTDYRITESNFFTALHSNLVGGLVFLGFSVLVCLPTFIHAIKKRRYLWAMLAIALNIIGVLIYWLYINRRDKNASA